MRELNLIYKASLLTVIIVCITFYQAKSQSYFNKIKAKLELGKTIETSEFRGQTIGSLTDSMGNDFLNLWFYNVGDRIDGENFIFQYDYNDSLILDMKITCSRVKYLVVTRGEVLLLPIDYDLLKKEIIYRVYFSIKNKNINDIANYKENEMITRNNLITMEYVSRFDSLFSDYYYTKKFKPIKDYEINELRITHFLKHLAGSTIKDIINTLGDPNYYMIDTGDEVLPTVIELRYNYNKDFAILLLITLDQAKDNIGGNQIEIYLDRITNDVFVSPIPITKRNDLIPFNK